MIRDNHNARHDQVGFRRRVFLPLATSTILLLTVMRPAQAQSIVRWGMYGFNNPHSSAEITQWALGPSHVSCVRADGSLSNWGYDVGRLCHPPGGLPHVKLVCSLQGLVLFNTGTVGFLRPVTSPVADIPKDLGIVEELDAGSDFAVVRRSDGTVRCWGSNAFGQCDIPIDLAPVVELAAGRNHIVVRCFDGTVRAWGDNQYGQCSAPRQLVAKSVTAGGRHSIALSESGILACWGSNIHHQCEPPATLRGVVAAAAGGDHSLALCKDGRVVAWGSNLYGQSSVPLTLQPAVQVAARENASAALTASGEVVVWGAALPEGSNVRLAPPPTEEDIVKITSGMNHTLAITRDGTVREWGVLKGQDGVAIPDGLAGVVDVAAGYAHSLALKESGEVAWWGYVNATPPPAGLDDAVQIAAGSFHSLALRGNGQIVCWGSNNSGQCMVPADVSSPDAPRVLQIAGGRYHSSAMRADGSIRSWGGGMQGTVPSGAIVRPVQIAAGGDRTVIRHADGTVSKLSFLSQVSPIPAFTDIVDIDTGDSTSYRWIVALKKDGTVLFDVPTQGPPQFPTNPPEGLTTIRDVSAGFFDVAAIQSHHELCASDLTRDRMVNGADLGALLTRWGQIGATHGDINGDFVVDSIDLGLLIGQWGPCPE